MHPTQGWPKHKAIYFCLLGLDLVFPVALSFGVQLVAFFCSGISLVLFYIVRISRCSNTLFLSSPHLWFLMGLFHNLFSPVFRWLRLALWGSPGVKVSLLDHCLWFIISLFHDLFDSCVDSLMIQKPSVFNHCRRRREFGSSPLPRPVICYWPFQGVLLLWFLYVTCCYVRVLMVSSNMVTWIIAAIVLIQNKNIW